MLSCPAVPATCSRRRLGGATAALAVGLAALLAPAGASAATVQVSTSGDDGTCAPNAGACRNIERGVAVAGSGDIVQVGPGDFPVFSTEVTGVLIDKRLDLRGAQYGVDARGRTGASESVLHPAADTPYQGLLYVEEGAARTSIRGFTIQGTPGSAGAGGAGIYTQSRGIDGGYTISENIIAGNTIGLLLHSSGETTEVSHNAFLANTLGPGAAAGNGIYSERAHNVRIVENRFEGNEQTGVLTAVGASGTNNVFSGNESINEAGPVFVNQAGLTVSGNSVTGGSRTAIALGGDGLHDATVTDNVISNRTGVRVQGIRLLWFGGKQNSDITIARNTVTGLRSDDPALANGIRIDEQGADGSVRITNNRLVDNTGAGLRNEDPDAVIDATENWWGCNDGPGFADCSDITRPGGSRPAYSPWLVLSLSAPGVFAARAGGSVLADLANRSSGGAASGSFFATGRAAFASTPAGTFDPPSAPLNADLKARSVLTIAQPPDEVSTTVDHQTVRIVPSNPPTPDVVPGIAVDDRTLSAGEVVGVKVSLTNQGNRTARRLQACLRVSARLKLSGSACRRIAALRPGQTIVYHLLARAKLNACRGPLPYRLRVVGGSLRAQVRRALGRLLAGACGNAPCPTAAPVRPSPTIAGPGRPAADRRPRARSAC